MSSSNIVLSVADWNPSSIKLLAPKSGKTGAKSVSIISEQTKRGIAISTPLMTTWGVGEALTADTKEGTGKYSLTLSFPGKDYESPATTEFLNKMKEFESHILSEAVKHSESWFGDHKSLEICKDKMFPIIKYPTLPNSKKIDTSKPPSLKIKVPFYDDKWGIEIYDTKQKLIFPSENKELSPIDFIPKLSNIACVLSASLWITEKAFGVTWKCYQCVVKPKVTYSIAGKCQIKLSEEEKDVIENQEIDEDDQPALITEDVHIVEKSSTQVDDSDNEEETREPEPIAEPEPEPVKAPAVKKVVKKATPAPGETEVPAEEPKAPAVKKVVKKKA
jgi:hypothetical protein